MRCHSSPNASQFSDSPGIGKGTARSILAHDLLLPIETQIKYSCHIQKKNFYIYSGEDCTDPCAFGYCSKNPTLTCSRSVENQCHPKFRDSKGKDMTNECGKLLLSISIPPPPFALAKNKGRFCNTIASVTLVHTSIQSD